MNKEKTVIGVQIPKFLVDSIDFIIDQQGYLGRADYIRCAIRKKVEYDLEGHDVDTLEKHQWSESEMDYKDMDIEKLEEWLKENRVKLIKSRVLNDHRKSNLEEIGRLLSSGISKNKIFALYGYIQKTYIFNYANDVDRAVE